MKSSLVRRVQILIAGEILAYMKGGDQPKHKSSTVTRTAKHPIMSYVTMMIEQFLYLLRGDFRIVWIVQIPVCIEHSP